MKHILKGYLSLTKLFKFGLYDYFKVKINNIFTNN